MSTREPTTGIVIVTHNSAGFLETCLEAASARCADIVVVDNASSDDTVRQARRFPNVRLIANPINRGFAAAVNQGIDLLPCDFILVLNPDAILHTGIDVLQQACAAPGYGAASGRLLDVEGKPQRGFNVRRFPTPWALAFESLGLNHIWRSNPVARRYRCLDLDPAEACDVEQPAGAFLMLRRDVWQQLGGFDERFRPLWFEDVDFLNRLHKAGFRTRYVPSAVASHYGGHSIVGLDPSKRVWYWYVNLLKYAAKHFRPVALRFVCASVGIGSFVRSVAGTVNSGGRRSFAQYGRVMQLAAKGVLGGRKGVESGSSIDNLDSERESDAELNTHSHGL